MFLAYELFYRIQPELKLEVSEYTCVKLGFVAREQVNYAARDLSTFVAGAYIR